MICSLSTFGDWQNNDYVSICSSDDEIKWERNNITYFDNDLMIHDSEKSTDCCVEIFMSNNDNSTFSKRSVDCNKRMTRFIGIILIIWNRESKKVPKNAIMSVV